MLNAHRRYLYQKIIRIMKTRLFLIIAFVFLTGSLSAQDNKASIALTAAIYEEEVTGNLNKAVDLYLGILKKHSDDRPVAAKTLYHLGLVNEKMGKQKASEYFTRLVNTYPDQADMVALAKTKLASLTGATSGSGSSTLSVRRVWSGADVTGKVSPDGRFVSCTDWETGDIAFHDLLTGQNRRLTDGSNPDATIEYSVPSPDSKSIAYYWSNDDSYDLRVVGLDNSKPKVLKTSGKEIHHFVPIAWSPDSKYLLSEFVKTDGNSDMMLINVADGSAKLLKEKGKGLPSDGDFSPDGSYIAWSTREGISLFELQTGIESLLIQDQSNHSVLGWAPDGKYVMFSSERSGSSDAWLIAVDYGKAKGAPIFIKKNWGFLSMGISRSGAFFYGVNNNVWGIKIAELNPSGGKVVTPLQSAFKHGNMRSPDWSPDGHFLAGVVGSEPSQAVIIHSMETGEERELKVGEWIIDLGQLRWMPDGKAIVVAASQAGKGENLIRIDMQTGQVTSLMSLPALGGWVHFSFSRDGNIIYYTRPDSVNMNEFTPVAHDLRSGKETIVTGEQGNVSPDGQNRLIDKSLDGYKTQTLYIKPVGGGEERELVKAFRGMASWTPDSRHIVFLKAINKDEQVPYKDTKWQLWRVADGGGEPEPLGLNFTGQFLGSLKISPDGRYVVIDDVGVNLEVWVMENFLPK
jgi:Tol biopolymer transport system component